MHTHPAEIEILYIQSGEIAWAVENGEAQITLAAGWARKQPREAGQDLPRTAAADLPHGRQPLGSKACPSASDLAAI
jgi:hypothetical protein